MQSTSVQYRAVQSNIEQYRPVQASTDRYDPVHSSQEQSCTDQYRQEQSIKAHYIPVHCSLTQYSTDQYRLVRSSTATKTQKQPSQNVSLFKKVPSSKQICLHWPLQFEASPSALFACVSSCPKVVNYSPESSLSSLFYLLMYSFRVCCKVTLSALKWANK